MKVTRSAEREREQVQRSPTQEDVRKLLGDRDPSYQGGVGLPSDLDSPVTEELETVYETAPPDPIEKEKALPEYTGFYRFMAVFFGQWAWRVRCSVV